MEKQRCCWLLLVVLSSAVAEDKATYLEVGGTLALGPPAASQSLTSILWKYNGNLLAEWVKDKVPEEYYGTFRDRTILNTTTGLLQIKNMAKADNGFYSVELNNKVQPDRYSVTVIVKVPKPELVVRPVACSSVLANCSLTCEGDTTDAGPVNYIWKKGNEVWEGKSEKAFNITNTGEIQRVETFTCRVENKINWEESKPQKNPFFQEENTDSSVGLGVGLGVFFILIVIVIGVVVSWKLGLIKNLPCYPQRRQDNEAENGVKSFSAGESTKDETERLRNHPSPES